MWWKHELFWLKTHTQNFCFIPFSDPSQLWKADGNGISNIATLSTYNITTEADYIYIENISNKKVLESTPNGTVVENNFKEGKIEQHWKAQGVPNTEGYFTLKETTGYNRHLTALSSNMLVMKGNCRFYYKYIKVT